MFSCLRRIQEFFSGKGDPNLPYFKCVFSGKIILKYIENKKKALGEFGSTLHRKIYENLHTVVAHLAFFEQFSGKFCLNFLPLNLSVSPNMMYFVRTFFIMRA